MWHTIDEGEKRYLSQSWSFFDYSWVYELSFCKIIEIVKDKNYKFDFVSPDYIVAGWIDISRPYFLVLWKKPQLD